MKSIFLIISALFLLNNLMNAQTPPANNKGAVITFEETSHDFGDIVQGQKVEYVFKYKNTGNEPLILSEVMTTCGCTATQWMKTPLAPNKESEIKATFNSDGKMGRQNKVITILSNASNNMASVSIVCNVLPPSSPASTTK